MSKQFKASDVYTESIDLIYPWYILNLIQLN